MTPHLGRGPFGIVLVIAAALYATPVSGQLIVNTLRGSWDDARVGWSGSANASIALSSGNSDYFQLAANGALQVRGQRNRVRLSVAEALLHAGGNKINENFVAHIRYNHRFGGDAPFSTILFAQIQHSPFWKVDRRTLLGVGGRYDVVGTDVIQVSVGATYMYETEKLVPEEDTPTDHDHRASSFLSFVAKPDGPVEIDVSGFYQPLLADFGDVRLLLVSNVAIRVTERVGVTTGLELFHDSRPAPDVERTEVKLLSGIQLSF